jgi:hypothetical protein
VPASPLAFRGHSTFPLPHELQSLDGDCILDPQQYSIAPEESRRWRTPIWMS